MMKQRKAVALMPLTILFIFVAVFIAAPCFAQTILGCYHHKNGKIRGLTDQYPSCKPNELPISWNMAWPKGEKGEKGDTGPQGPEEPSAGASVVSESGQYLGVLVDSDGSYTIYTFTKEILCFMA